MKDVTGGVCESIIFKWTASVQNEVMQNWLLKVPRTVHTANAQVKRSGTQMVMLLPRQMDVIGK